MNTYVLRADGTSDEQCPVQAYSAYWSEHQVYMYDDLRPIALRLMLIMAYMGMRPEWCEYGAN